MLKEIYNNVPIFMQNIMCSIQGALIKKQRYGGLYKAYSDDFVAGKQLDFLFALNSYFEKNKNIPYVFRLFEEGYFPLNSLDDFQSVPYLKKDDVRLQPGYFINSEAKDIKYIETSGTSGKGLSFPVTKASEKIMWAHFDFYRSMYGITTKTWCGYFSGRDIVPIHQKKKPFWRMNYPGKQILFSQSHLSENTISEYIWALNRFQPLWIHGYPSLLSILSKIAIDLSLRLNYKPQLVTCGSETLSSTQRKSISKFFDCHVSQLYGQAEGVAIFFECPQYKMHINDRFSYVEFIKKDDENYEIVGSNVFNDAFSFIRYQTGDTCTAIKYECGCGIPGRYVDQIYGRDDDAYQLLNGREIGRLGHVFKGLFNVREAQIFSPCPGNIILKIVKSSGYSTEDEQVILSRLKSRIGDKENVTFDYVSKIPRTKRGKVKFVVRGY